MNRALAHIETVKNIEPIEGADNIELITILGWKCVAKKEEFHIGDKALYIEIDSKCPATDERFAFLEKKHYNIRTMKLNKFHVISQGLALPLDEFPEFKGLDDGTDVTDKLGIVYSIPEDNDRKADYDSEKDFVQKHKNKFTMWLMKYKYSRKFLLWLFYRSKESGAFPSFATKSDENRIESEPWRLNDRNLWVATEKLDGSSTTFTLEKHRFGKYDFAVCSRNRRIPHNKANENDNYIKLAEKYDIEAKLKDMLKTIGGKKIVLQGEMIGPGIQKNPYKLKEREFHAFNLYLENFDGSMTRVGSVEMAKILKGYRIPTVPILDAEHELPYTMEDMKAEATGKSVINPNVMREGIVYRSPDGQKSFKNVSNEYLLRNNG